MNQAHAPPDMRFFSTIREVPGALWDAKIARGHPFKSSAFLSCLEDSFPERRFTYMVLIKGEAVVGLTVLTEEQMDLSLLMPGAVRWFVSALRKLFPSFLSLRLGMVGTFETTQRHWWFDPDRLTAQAFAEALITACDKVCARSMLLLIRDFTARDREDALLQACILDRGFRQGDNHPLAAVELEGLGIEGHLQRLKKKSRQNLRKKLREAEKLGLKLTREHDFRHLIDACYPLYLQVHESASEFKRNPMPKVFFEALAERMPRETSLLTLRTRENRLIAFILTGTSDAINNPFVIGMDYAATRETPAYYFMIWKEIEYAAQRGCQIVDLGLTSYFVKQAVGAELEGLTMAARIGPTWLRPVLSPLVPFLLSAKQPSARRKFRVDVEGQPRPSPARSKAA